MHDSHDFHGKIFVVHDFFGDATIFLWARGRSFQIKICKSFYHLSKTSLKFWAWRFGPDRWHSELWAWEVKGKVEIDWLTGFKWEWKPNNCADVLKNGHQSLLNTKFNKKWPGKYREIELLCAVSKQTRRFWNWNFWVCKREERSMTISEKSTHRKLAAYNYQFIMIRVKLDHIKIKKYI